MVEDGDVVGRTVGQVARELAAQFGLAYAYDLSVEPGVIWVRWRDGRIAVHPDADQIAVADVQATPLDSNVRV